MAENHDFEVVVNGRERTVTQREQTFKEVVALAFNPVPEGPDVSFTIAFRHAHSKPHDGTLPEGGTVEVKDGTIFDVTQTDKS